MSHDPQSPSDAADFDDDDPDDFDDCDQGFECAAYWVGNEWYCPLAGTEECDWECAETLEEDPTP